MLILTILLLLLVFFAIMDYAHGFKFWLSAHLDRDGVLMDIKYLYPFIRINVTIRENVPFLIVYIFGAKLIKARMIRKGNKKQAFNGTRFLKAANVRHLMISTSYGFDDPFTTGIVYGALCSAVPFLQIEEINQTPDFMSSEMYVDLNANANFNLGHTIVNYFKNK